MKVTITKKHEYLTGWTMYDMVWKTDYVELGKNNFKVQSAIVVTKEPFSNPILKKWAVDKGCDIDVLFTERENSKEDCEKMNKLVHHFNIEYGNNLNLLNSDNKCHVEYSATISPNCYPLKTAFEIFHAYDVKVRIEYKSGVLEMVFPSQGREKNSACTRVVFSGKSMKAVYEAEEAIETIKCFIGRYIDDCNTDDKFKNLPKILDKIQSDLKRIR